MLDLLRVAVLEERLGHVLIEEVDFPDRVFLQLPLNQIPAKSDSLRAVNNIANVHPLPVIVREVRHQLGECLS